MPVSRADTSLHSDSEGGHVESGKGFHPPVMHIPGTRIRGGALGVVVRAPPWGVALVGFEVVVGPRTARALRVMEMSVFRWQEGGGSHGFGPTMAFTQSSNLRYCAPQSRPQSHTQSHAGAIVRMKLKDFDGSHEFRQRAGGDTSARQMVGPGATTTDQHERHLAALLGRHHEAGWGERAREGDLSTKRKVLRRAEEI